MNDWQLQYRWLQHDLFGDTLLDKTKSKHGNKYAEVFATKFGWLRVFTMAKKGGAYEALSLLFKRYGVPPNMIVDGLKEQTLGDFKRKVAEAGCHLRKMKPEPPWQIAVEGGYCELKRGSGKSMTKMK